jgi:hypothetical protein
MKIVTRESSRELRLFYDTFRLSPAMQRKEMNVFRGFDTVFYRGYEIHYLLIQILNSAKFNFAHIESWNL